MISKIKLFTTITYIESLKKMMRFTDSIFFQKNNFSDSDENEIKWKGYLWHELEFLTLATEFGLEKFSTQRVSH